MLQFSAIVVQYPSGERRYVHAGNYYPQPVARYAWDEWSSEVIGAIERMRANPSNRDLEFFVVEYPAPRGEMSYARGPVA